MTIDYTEFFSTEAKLRQVTVMKMPVQEGGISLFSGLPHPDCFPIKGLSIDYLTPDSQFKKQSTLSIKDPEGESGNGNVYEALQYMNSQGTSFFRKWCKQHIIDFHEPSYSNWDFVIEAGATQSTDAILRTFCDPGDFVLCDNFTYPCFVESCKPLRVEIVPVDVDSDGIDPKQMDETLSKMNKKPKFYYAVPVGHNPLGYTMSLERKLEVYKVCQKHNILIVEDDPYFHLQLPNEDGTPPPPVSSFLKLDTDGRVLRIDSFSKMLMPGSRCSILTANKTFIENILLVHSMVNQFTKTLSKKKRHLNLCI
ncbi:unnamed protein product [Ambrosiozyma monospora]|uniref:Unnamed protein product n=1 Tax=Ambrosiozyma monospora TaxID=43982 RepID=A0A9W7DFR0_AMBMO|nr:unnamed protein product [Ambrosiozyma monospora]